MALNSSGIRDTSRVLADGKNTVIATIKDKVSEVVPVNPYNRFPDACGGDQATH